MSILKSVFLGSEGHYYCSGSEIHFHKGCIDEAPPSETSFRRRLIHVLHQRYLYTFVHELAHAIAFRFIAKSPFAINVYQGDANGCTNPLVVKPLSSTKDFICIAIGPTATMAFAGVMLVSSLTCRKYILPLWFTWGAIVGVKEEIQDNIRSGLDKDEGDFGSIVKISDRYLAAATVAQIVLLALSIFGVYKTF